MIRHSVFDKIKINNAFLLFFSSPSKTVHHHLSSVVALFSDRGQKDLETYRVKICNAVIVFITRPARKRRHTSRDIAKNTNVGNGLT